MREALTPDRGTLAVRSAGRLATATTPGRQCGSIAPVYLEDHHANKFCQQRSFELSAVAPYAHDAREAILGRLGTIIVLQSVHN